MRKSTVIIAAVVAVVLVVGGTFVVKAVTPSDGAPSAANVRCEPGYSPPALWQERESAVLDAMYDLMATKEYLFGAAHLREPGLEIMRVTIYTTNQRVDDDMMAEVESRALQALCGLHIEVRMEVETDQVFCDWFGDSDC